MKRISGRVKRVFLIGESRNILATFLGAEGVSHHVCRDLAEAVKLADSLAEKEDNILLSPGFSSLDQFSGYADRGQKFQTLVGSLPTPTHS